MGELRENILKQELQKEIEIAKKLEASGKSKQAGPHYRKAAIIYRRLAYISRKENADKFFNNASEYEAKGMTISTTTPYTRAVDDDAIKNMIVREKPDVTWEDIGGLGEIKDEIKESMMIPLVGNKPAYVESSRNILLYGPPGTGKTMIAKACSNMLDAPFFEVKASSLLSKYFGESEKIIARLFMEAAEKQPSIIFIDEIDSIILSRSSDINEGTRRVIGQMLTEIDGFSADKTRKVIIIAATNRPWDLDEALLSRFQKKIYVPLPDQKSREMIFELHLKGAELDSITEESLGRISEGFSGREISVISREAIMNMIREMNPDFHDVNPKTLEKCTLKERPLKKEDFDNAFSKIKKVTDKETIEKYKEWGDQGL
ncbi:MAG: ATP-binding protein [Candidatus Aenigmarchaeota archaeon]|nr:ATP-binding protein [Candidatus Aenigmarchaeota archaeon]